MKNSAKAPVNLLYLRRASEGRIKSHGMNGLPTKKAKGVDKMRGVPYVVVFTTDAPREGTERKKLLSHLEKQVDGDEH